MGWNGLNPMSDALTGAAITAALLGTGLSLPDNKWTLTKAADATAKQVHSLANYTAATTRTITWPDASGVPLLSAAALTTGRVVYTTTGGLGLSSANLTFDGTNFAHAGAGTFATGTGAVTLNGDTTFAGTKRLGFGATSTSAAVFIGTSWTGNAGASHYTFRTEMEVGLTGTTRGVGYYSAITTAAVAVTVPDLIQFGSFVTIALGAGSAVTNSIDLYTRARVIGTNNAAWYNGNSQTSAFAGNWCMYNQAGTANYLGSGVTSNGNPVTVAVPVSGGTSISPGFQCHGTTGTGSSVVLARYAAATSSAHLVLAKSRGATAGALGLVTSGDSLGALTFCGDDGVQFREAGSMRIVVDGVAAAGDMPGKWILATSPAGTVVPVDRLSVDKAGAVLALSPLGGLGYGTGSGGTITQITSKSTGVTLNKVVGAITLNAASLAATTSVGFTLTNSAIAAADAVLVSVKSGATADSYLVTVDAVAAGSCRISLRNITAGALAEAVVLTFAVIKGATT